MSTQVALQCQCSKVRGVATGVSPETGNRIVCYCGDCQAFVHFLGRGDVLDVAGGTDILQLSPSSVRITEGTHLLRCVRLSEKGLFRWYTDCCRTPVGNMLGPRFPFLGLIHSFMAHDGEGCAHDDQLGKPVAFIHGSAAVGGVPAHAHRTVPFGMLVRCARLMVGWWITGKGAPSPFVNAKTKTPYAEPRVLTAAERQALGQPGSGVAQRA